MERTPDDVYMRELTLAEEAVLQAAQAYVLDYTTATGDQLKRNLSESVYDLLRVQMGEEQMDVGKISRIVMLYSEGKLKYDEMRLLLADEGRKEPPVRLLRNIMSPRKKTTTSSRPF